MQLVGWLNQHQDHRLAYLGPSDGDPAVGLPGHGPELLCEDCDESTPPDVWTALEAEAPSDDEQGDDWAPDDVCSKCGKPWDATPRPEAPGLREALAEAYDSGHFDGMETHDDVGYCQHDGREYAARAALPAPSSTETSDD